MHSSKRNKGKKKCIPYILKDFRCLAVFTLCLFHMCLLYNHKKNKKLFRKHEGIHKAMQFPPCCGLHLLLSLFLDLFHDAIFLKSVQIETTKKLSYGGQLVPNCDSNCSSSVSYHSQGYWLKLKTTLLFCNSLI